MAGRLHSRIGGSGRRGLRNLPEKTGFPAPIEQHGGDGAPLSVAWIEDELLQETRRVWSDAYGRILTVEEGMEILMNVRRLAAGLMHGKQGDDEE